MIGVQQISWLKLKQMKIMICLDNKASFVLLIGVCSVFLIEEDRVVTVQSSNLEPILPRTKDMFKVLSGEQRDQMGQVVSITGREVIVRYNHSNETSMVPSRMPKRLLSRAKRTFFMLIY